MNDKKLEDISLNLPLEQEMHSKRIRVIFYIDGFNLYYGIKKCGKPRFKWLDIEKMARGFLGDNMILHKVKYFTAMVKRDEDALKRQINYHNALKSECEKIEIIKGKFIVIKRLCTECHQRYQSFEEKQSDVNIACHLLKDLYSNSFDCAYIISADSDLLMPVEIIKGERGKKVNIIFPPNRKSGALSEKIKPSEPMVIWESLIRNCLLPKNIETAAGARLSIPEEWNS